VLADLKRRTPSFGKLPQLLRLVTAGEAEPIRAWLRRTEAPLKAFEIIRRGLRDEDSQGPTLAFDEIEVARLEYDDGPDTSDILYARRVGGAFFYRVWFDGSGEWAFEFEESSPLPRREIRRLFASPPWLEGDIPCDTTVIYPSNDTVWEQAGDRDRRTPEEPDGGVTLESGLPVPCPLCDSDYLSGDNCAHLLSSLMIPEDAGDWTGPWSAIRGLVGALEDFSRRVGHLPDRECRAAVKTGIPPRLRKMVMESVLGGTNVSVQDFIDARFRRSPTRAGEVWVEKTGMLAESWTVFWDSMSATRGREIGRELSQAAREIRLAARGLKGRH
jgi:hypothetical protein